MQRLERLVFRVVEHVTEDHEIRLPRQRPVPQDDGLVPRGIASDAEIQHLEAPVALRGVVEQ
jgi:hypothetical protein